MTLYQQLIHFEVDDQRFLCIGDNISGLSFSENRDHIHSFIPKNRTPVTSYPDMSRQILERNPDFLLTGHGGGVPYDRAKVERWQLWMDKWQQNFVQILDQPHPNLGMDPHWIEFYPHRVHIRPGDAEEFQIKITNHEAVVRSCVLRLRSVAGVRLEPAEFTLDVPPEDVTSVSFTAHFPPSFTTHALPIVADVIWAGRSLREVAEAIAYW